VKQIFEAVERTVVFSPTKREVADSGVLLFLELLQKKGNSIFPG
jgi:hypothetical protein